MTKSVIKEVLPYNINTVWNAIRNIEAYPQWRSNISRVEILDDARFVEYGKNAFPTTFIITKEEKPFLWEFDIDNSNIQGHWIGILHETENGTETEFTEVISVKKLILRPFVKAYLKKQQSRFMEDLKHHCKIKGDN